MQGKAINLLLNSGRIRDQWHTMTRTSKATELNQHISKPQLSINSLDAKRLNINDGDWLSVTSNVGQVLLTATVVEEVQVGHCFMPIHWNRQFASTANAASVYQAVIDPISLQPQSKQVRVVIEKVNFKQMLHLNVNSDLANLINPADFDYFHKSMHKGFVHYTLAGNSESSQLSDAIKQMLGSDLNWLSLLSNQQGYQRLIAEQAGRLQASIDWVDLSMQPHIPPINHGWLSKLFGQEVLQNQDKVQLLTGTVSDEYAKGELVCSCFSVHQKDIEDAIDQGCRSVEQLGKQLKCGTGCGSCKPELSHLLENQQQLIIREKV